jgi:tetratricopeptide (TPR) repeat protein
MRIRRLHVNETNYSIAGANDDLEVILGSGAVVSGPYGPALTIDTDLHSFIHLFQVAEVDPNLFRDNPITHLAMDISNFREAVKNYPQLEQIAPVARYYIRDIEVGLYRVSRLFQNPEANSYSESAVERSLDFIKRQQPDSALTILEPLYAAHPESRTVSLALADCYRLGGEMRQAYDVLMETSRRFPTDFDVQLQTGRFLQLLAFEREDQSLYQLAETYFQKAVEVNRYRARYAYNIWSAANKAFGRDNRP